MTQEAIVSTEEKSGIVILRLNRSEVSLFEVTNVQSAILNASGGKKNAILDLAAVQTLDSSAIIMLVKIAEAFQARGGELILIGVQGFIRESLSITYVDHIVEIVETESEALKKLMDPDKVADSVKRVHNALIFRGESRYNVVPLDEITHLSSQGKSTIIHSVRREFVANRLLKDMQARLPETFIRIHKGHIVNSNFVEQLEYSSGGMYELTLSNPARTVLPVGRSFAAELKNSLKH